MNLLSYIKKNGIKHAWDIFYQYKIDIIIQKIMSPFLRKKELKDIIVIESHNDFDSNGGAFYDYLIKKGYNKKYKIVWLLKHPKFRPKKLPENVTWVPLFKPSFKKNYYYFLAKYFTCDCHMVKKLRYEQKTIFFGHGTGGLKNVKGLVNIPDDVDFMLVQSEYYAPIQAEQYSLLYPNNKFVYLGFPTHDVLHNCDKSELLKVTDKQFNKVIIWMPTFRKGGGFKRNDSAKEQALGIPLLQCLDEFNELNKYLKSNNSLLIIKIHPMQDLSELKIKSLSNIVVLTGEDVKIKGIDNYRLLPCTDALISDYSGVAYEYLQVDKPIAYVLDDMNEYKLGFVVDDIDRLLAGKKIFTFDDMMSFINNIVNGKDEFAEKRHQVRDFIYKYNDANSCERIVKFMGLKL
jgi:CDP-glycerol glycerophosphotransferase (TagB/SpsB family)